jgi:cytochrome c oxidase assembly protein subunit 15
MSQAQSRGVYRFAVATSSFTILLLMAGALVTSNDAADSVPDWPLAYHRLIPPLVGGIRFEYAHRVVAGVVAVLTAILAIWLARTGTSRLARRLGWVALGLVIAQAVLGGIRVLLGHPALVATAHATLAQLFFITVVSLALFTSSWWQRELPKIGDSTSPHLRPLAAWTTAAIFVQLILGAGFRHGAFGVLPHIVGAAVVTFLVVWTGHTVRKRFGQIHALRRRGIYLQAFLGTQILLGVAAYKAASEVQPTGVYVVLTVAHVLVGALTLASCVLLTLSCYRLIGPVESAAAGLPAIAPPPEGTAQGSRA